MTALFLLKLAASIFAFSLCIVFANFLAIASDIRNGKYPAWWMFGIHILFGVVAWASGLTALIAGAVWLFKNLQ